MTSFVRRMSGAIKLYKFGIFNIVLNRVSPKSFLYRNFIFYSLDLTKGLPNALIIEDGYHIMKIENEVSAEFAKFRKSFPAEEFVNRIRQPNQSCYVVKEDEVVIAYAWAVHTKAYIDVINLKMHLEEKEIYIYACYVSPENRGRGLYPALLQRIMEDSKKDQFRSAWIGVSAANTGSVHGIEKAGFKKNNRIKYLKWGKREWWFGLSASPHKFESADNT